MWPRDACILPSVSQGDCGCTWYRVVRTVRYEGIVLKNAPTSDTNYKFVNPFRELLNLRVVMGLPTRDSSNYFTHLLQGKDTDQNQPEEEVHGAEAARVPNMKLPLS